MEIIASINFIDIFLHLDKYLTQVVDQYHTWVYLILFAIIFCETGLVVTPFLPGDSLLFAAGSIAALPESVLHVGWLYLALSLAAILGDSSNYWIGRFIGPKIFSKEKVKFLNKKHLDETHAFYERHGGKTVFIARFMPIIRTFAPFVAGIGKMQYLKFLAYSISGTICWIGAFVMGGYLFGSVEFVKKNFTIVIMAIIAVSLMPAVIGFLRSKFGKTPEQAQAAEKDDRTHVSL
jgi:membrane-associated protein